MGAAEGRGAARRKSAAWRLRRTGLCRESVQSQAASGVAGRGISFRFCYWVWASAQWIDGDFRFFVVGRVEVAGVLQFGSTGIVAGGWKFANPGDAAA